jgi:hypothetical protein
VIAFARRSRGPGSLAPLADARRLHQWKRPHGIPASGDNPEYQDGTRQRHSARRHDSLLRNQSDSAKQRGATTERGARGKRRGIRKREQRLEVCTPLAGDAHRELVDRFLARQSDSGDKPPHRRMKPQRRSQQLFSDDPQPVASPDVQQLMSDHGALNLRRL